LIFHPTNPRPERQAAEQALEGQGLGGSGTKPSLKLRAVGPPEIGGKLGKIENLPYEKKPIFKR